MHGSAQQAGNCNRTLHGYPGPSYCRPRGLLTLPFVFATEGMRQIVRGTTIPVPTSSDQFNGLFYKTSYFFGMNYFIGYQFSWMEASATNKN